MGEEIQARLRRNAREPYTWLMTVMALSAIALYVTSHKGLWMLMTAVELVTAVVDRRTASAARSHR